MSEINNETFSLVDIEDKKSRENFDLLVNYLCSKPIYNYDISKVDRNKPEPEIKLKRDNFYDLLNDIAKILYNKENFNTVIYIINERSDIKPADYYYGFAKIYDLDEPILLNIGGMDTYASVSVTIHELTHIIAALNNNNPSKQYNEFLSIFSELLAIDYFSQIKENEDIFTNHLFNKLINRMSKRIYSNNLYLEDNSLSWLLKMYQSNYTYFIGLIYALRLFELYKNDKETILCDFNNILLSKYTVKELLDKYNINLNNEDTINCFKNNCDFYEQKILEKYEHDKLSFVK